MDLEARVAAVRRFNRFYTRRIGVLQRGLLGSPYSLAEARVLFELAHQDRPTAAALAELLDLDPGYLSRILRSFGARGLVSRTRSGEDQRRVFLTLTRRGRAAFGVLDRRAAEEVRELLERIGEGDQARLAGALQTIESLLGEARPPGPVVIRSHKPGDIGWVIHRHGALYAEEYGWDETFEALVAQIAGRFLENEDRRRERCFIAERDAEILGCVFLVAASETEAKLRLLLVEPRARGLGLGGRLVSECLRFARQAGYGKVSLWTNDVLKAARKIYVKAGFTLVHREPHHRFGHDLVGETWELDLGGSAAPRPQLSSP
jgi:DNA-binding MarR family transcriptional regulator/GNAT superfamily N-acetyltransferase